MAAAQGVMAVTSAVSGITAKNAQKRQMKEQAQAQKYFANLQYENELIAANAQREAQRQQFSLQQMQAQATRLQEDYNLKEQEIQNLIQASDAYFKSQSELLAQETAGITQLAQADKQDFQAGQDARLRQGQARQESEQQNQAQAQVLDQVQAALAKGDTELASFLAMTAAQGQDSSSVSTQVVAGQAKQQAAMQAAQAALESGRFSEQDYKNLLLSDQFTAALKNLGVLDAESTRVSTGNKLDYARQNAQATQGNISREANQNQQSIDSAKGILSGQRVLQDRAMSLSDQFNELGYQNGLSNLELQKASANTSANLQNRAANNTGANLFDYLNLGVSGYGAYTQATGKPLFSKGGAAASMVPSQGKELFRMDTGSSAYMG